ncbi:hypothetical protein ACVWW4_007458 [Bradyrhizobium sp. LB7.1]
MLETFVQHLAGRAGEEIEQIAALLQCQPAQDVGALECIHGLADRRRAKTVEHIGRRAQHELPEHVGDLFQLARKSVERVCVMGAQPCDGRLRPSFTGEEITAVGRGQEILRAPLDDPQALLGQLEVTGHLRIEQAHGVGSDRIAEARMKLLRDRGPANHLAALDHVHAQAGHREIGRAGQAVVASADDDDVGFDHEGAKLFHIHSGTV